MSNRFIPFDTMLHALYHARTYSFLKNLTINIVLLLVAVLLFSASFPNSLLRFGWGFLSFVAIFPVYVLAHRNALYTMPLWGFLYGFCTYLVFNIWLSVFNPNASLLVPAIFGVYFIIHFLVIKLFMLTFPRWGFLLLPFCWLAYEYLRTLGFLGYSFGVIGYVLSFYSILIQIVDIFGVWFLCLIIVFPSALLYQYLYVCSTRSTSSFSAQNTSLGMPFHDEIHTKNQNGKSCARSIVSKVSLVYVITMVVVLIYGIVAQVDYTNSTTKKIVLIQHDTDPWKGALNTYKKSLEKLIHLSKTVLAQDDVYMVVWSETAFVPSIKFHLTYKENAQYVALINRLLRFFEQYPNIYFLIGNGEGKRVFDEDNYPQRIDYNASILFKGNKRLDSYYKLHLVPFTEYFPYKRSLAFFYNILKKKDVHFWEPGSEHTVFHSSDLRFSTPICFEDGFGYQNALFVQKGAEILINITNDAWSRMEVNAMQHLQLSILRAVENRRSVLRSTNAGMTAIIDPNGKILQMLPSFVQDSIVYDVPIYTEKTTLYTRYKDFLAQASLVLVIVLCIYVILKKRRYCFYG